MVEAPFGDFVTGRHDVRTAAIVGGIIATLAWTSLVFFQVPVASILVGSIVSLFGNAMILAAVPILLMAVAPEFVAAMALLCGLPAVALARGPTPGDAVDSSSRARSAQ